MSDATAPPVPPDGSFDAGLLLGVLIGEGSFGGDGRQPQITLRMHVRHEALFRWLERTVPVGRLYGPYAHGGREYYQWMVRGEALRQHVAPFIARHLDAAIDGAAHARFLDMCARYGIAVPDAGERRP